MQESQAIEANQRYLLGQLTDGRVADGEGRDAIDAVVAHRIRKQDVRVEESSTKRPCRSRMTSDSPAGGSTSRQAPTSPARTRLTAAYSIIPGCASWPPHHVTSSR